MITVLAVAFCGPRPTACPPPQRDTFYRVHPPLTPDHRMRSDGRAGLSLGQNGPERPRPGNPSVIYVSPCSARRRLREVAEETVGRCHTSGGDTHHGGAFPSTHFSASPFPVHLSVVPRDREDGGSEARPLPPKGSLPFGRGGGAVPPPLPVSFFSDDPVEVRLEIERDGVA
jgi:hypothetical protein